MPTVIRSTSFYDRGRFSADRVELGGCGGELPHGIPDFRVGGRIFATLAHEKQGYGNLMLTPDHQAAFVEEQPDIFVPIHGGWGRMGMTHIRLAEANEDVLTGALQVAWKLRLEKNAGTRTTKRASVKKRLRAR